MLGQLYLYLIVINYTHTHTHTHGGRQRELIWRNPEFPESRIQISSTQAADLLGTKSRRQISEIIFITRTQNPESQFQIPSSRFQIPKKHVCAQAAAAASSIVIKTIMIGLRQPWQGIEFLFAGFITLLLWIWERYW